VNTLVGMYKIPFNLLKGEREARMGS